MQRRPTKVPRIRRERLPRPQRRFAKHDDARIAIADRADQRAARRPRHIRLVAPAGAARLIQRARRPLAISVHAFELHSILRTKQNQAKRTLAVLPNDAAAPQAIKRPIRPLANTKQPFPLRGEGQPAVRLRLHKLRLQLLRLAPRHAIHRLRIKILLRVKHELHLALVIKHQRIAAVMLPRERRHLLPRLQILRRSTNHHDV